MTVTFICPEPGSKENCPKSDFVISNKYFVNLRIGEEGTADDVCAQIGTRILKYGLSTNFPYQDYSCPCNNEYEDITYNGPSCSYYYRTKNCDIAEKHPGCICTDSDNCHTEPVTYCNISDPPQYIKGKVPTCKRKRFTADPTQCCISAIRTNGVNKTSTDGNRTCDFKYRSIASNDCVGYIIEYCLKPENRAEWKEDGVCKKYMDLVPNPNYSNSLLESAIKSSGRPSFSSKKEEDVEYINTLLYYCKKSPGICDTKLDEECKNYTRYDMDDFVNRLKDCKNGCVEKNMLNACACHLDDDEYRKYAGIIEQGYKECDQLCILPSSIKRGSSGTPVSCTQTNCVMNNITVDVVNSKTGDIKFEEICGSCGRDTGCNCYFNDINVYIEGSNTGKLDFSQMCETCTIFDPLDPTKRKLVSCETGAEITKLQLWLQKKRNLLIFSLLILLLLLIVFLFIKSLN